MAKIPFHWFWCKQQGVNWQYGWRLSGRPTFRIRGQGARIVIGKRFSGHSISRGNSIGVFQPIILTAWGDNACIQIGDDVGISGCSITALESIIIGNRVLIGSGVLIMDTNAHPLHPNDRLRNVPPVNASVTIADDVFIGARAIILKGVCIGKGSVVAAGSVVVKSVAPYTVVGGNPAKVIGNTLPHS